MSLFRLNKSHRYISNSLKTLYDDLACTHVKLLPVQVSIRLVMFARKALKAEVQVVDQELKGWVEDQRGARVNSQVFCF